jgi:CRP/FNR family cyclic AMP-dependent transcriptional regulator
MVSLFRVGCGSRWRSPRGELAGWGGVSRKAVSNALGVLRGRGWIQTGRKQIIVTDLDALRTRAT